MVHKNKTFEYFLELYSNSEINEVFLANILNLYKDEKLYHILECFKEYLNIDKKTWLTEQILLLRTKVLFHSLCEEALIEKKAKKRQELIKAHIEEIINETYDLEYLDELVYLISVISRKIRIFNPNNIAGKYNLPIEIKQELFKKQKNRCAICFELLIGEGKEKFEVDHIRPSMLQGDGNNYSNIQLLCPVCNRYKSNAISYPEITGWTKPTFKILKKIKNKSSKEDSGVKVAFLSYFKQFNNFYERILKHEKDIKVSKINEKGINSFHNLKMT